MPSKYQFEAKREVNVPKEQADSWNEGGDA